MSRTEFTARTTPLLNSANTPASPGLATPAPFPPPWSAAATPSAPGAPPATSPATPTPAPASAFSPAASPASLAPAPRATTAAPTASTTPAPAASSASSASPVTPPAERRRAASLRPKLPLLVIGQTAPDSGAFYGHLDRAPPSMLRAEFQQEVEERVSGDAAAASSLSPLPRLAATPFTFASLAAFRFAVVLPFLVQAAAASATATAATATTTATSHDTYA